MEQDLKTNALLPRKIHGEQGSGRNMNQGELLSFIRVSVPFTVLTRRLQWPKYDFSSFPLLILGRVEAKQLHTYEVGLESCFTNIVYWHPDEE